MKLRCTSISDATLLQDLVLQEIESIERDVKIFETGLDTAWGLVSLGLDPGGRLVILLILGAEGETSEKGRQDDQVSRLIGIYRWIMGMMPFLSRSYAGRGLDGTRHPRVLVIAPDDSRTFIEALGYLRFKVDCYRYQGIEVQGEPSLILIPSPPRSHATALKNTAVSKSLLKSTELSGEEVHFFEEDPPEVE